ncbi:MAG: hypothetical protein AAGA20_18725 [Planctomycetota bacterium]
MIPFLGSLPLALAQRPPDSPLGDILGWLIVFFVIVWPIIKGLLDKAAEQHRNFEQRQRRAAGGGEARTEPKRSRIDQVLEDMLSAPRDAVDAEPEMPPPVPRRRPKPPAPRPVPEPVSQQRLEGAEAFPGTELGRDPFDETLLQRDLGAVTELAQVASENEIEVTGPVEMTSLDRVAPATQVHGSQHDPSEDALARIRAGKTPWQSAFLLREVLGPPVAARDFDPPARR